MSSLCGRRSTRSSSGRRGRVWTAMTVFSRRVSGCESRLHGRVEAIEEDAALAHALGLEQQRRAVAHGRVAAEVDVVRAGIVEEPLHRLRDPTGLPLPAALAGMLDGGMEAEAREPPAEGVDLLGE